MATIHLRFIRPYNDGPNGQPIRIHAFADNMADINPTPDGFVGNDDTKNGYIADSKAYDFTFDLDTSAVDTLKFMVVKAYSSGEIDWTNNQANVYLDGKNEKSLDVSGLIGIDNLYVIVYNDSWGAYVALKNPTRDVVYLTYSSFNNERTDDIVIPETISGVNTISANYIGKAYKDGDHIMLNPC